MVQGIGVGNLGVGVDVVIERTHPHVTGGKNQVRFVHRANYVHGTECVRLQFQRIDVNHNLAIFPAVGRRHRGARNTGYLVANLKLQVIVKLSFVESLAIYGEQANGKARSIDLHDDGREGAFGQGGASQPWRDWKCW